MADVAISGTNSYTMDEMAIKKLKQAVANVANSGANSYTMDEMAIRLFLVWECQEHGVNVLENWSAKE